MGGVGATGVLLPALFAGLVAVGVTVAIERWGGRLGGLVGTMPSTIVPAAVGMAAAGDPVAFNEAMWVVPVGMFLNTAFLYAWRVVPPWLPAWRLGPRLALMLALSLSVWLALAGLVAAGTSWMRDAHVPLVGVGLGFTVAIAVFGLLASSQPRPAPRGHRKVSPTVLVARGLLAATAIGTAVWLSSRGDGVIAGVASVFPAIFITTMVALWLSQGEAVQAGAVGPMMLGGTSVAAYALLATWLLPSLGLALGSLLTWILSVVAVTVPAWWWLQRRAAVHRPPLVD